jgi:hypothetical protein
MFAEVQIASLFALPLRMLGSARLRQPRSHGQVPESLRSGIRRVHCRVVIGSFRRRRPATVLCHSHDEKLWNIKQMRIKGRLERRADQWVFISTDFRRRPRSQLTLYWGLSRDMRNAGRRYLDRRGLVIPTVNWKALQALRRSTSAKTSSRLL